MTTFVQKYKPPCHDINLLCHDIILLQVSENVEEDRKPLETQKLKNSKEEKNMKKEENY